MASKLSLFFGNALRSASRSSRTPIPTRPLRAFCAGIGQEFSDVPAPTAETIQEQSASATPENSGASFDPFPQVPKSLVFAKLTGTGRSTLKTDVVRYFEGCNLRVEDIKVEYNGLYNPTGMILQFASREAFDMATKTILRNGRFYKLNKVDRAQWDLLECFNGKVAVLQGLPRNALPEDVERFLCGCNYDASETRFFMRAGFPEPMKLALVHFPSRYDAMHAFRVKNHGFCLNNPIMVRVLQ